MIFIDERTSEASEHVSEANSSMSEANASTTAMSEPERSEGVKNDLAEFTENKQVWHIL